MSEKTSTVTIHYGNQRFPVAVNLNETLSELIDDLLETTEISEKKVKLFYAGKRLKDKKASLSKLGLKNHSKILCIRPHKQQRGSKEKDTVEPAPKAEAENPVFSRISGEIKAIDQYVDKELSPMYDNYVNKPSNDPKQKNKQKLMISELLLQQLLKLDGVDVLGSEKLRSERKQLVSKIQKMLDHVDQTSQEVAA
ncbi:BAG family molecular chaperone regulator 1A [Schizosaccharomyces pombe]